MYRTYWFIQNTIAIFDVDAEMNDWAIAVSDFDDIWIMKIREEKRAEYLELEKNALPNEDRIKLHQKWLFESKLKVETETARVVIMGELS